TGGPARGRMRFREAEGLAAQLAEGKTRRSVEQNIAERVAAAAAQRAEPWIGKFPGRKGIVGAGQLEVGFDAEHPATALPVVAGLDAADEARGLGRVVGDGAPVIAEIAAEIGAGPAIGIKRLVDGVELAGRIEIGGVRLDSPTPASAPCR